jgi:hypothetical protein
LTLRINEGRHDCGQDLVGLVGNGAHRDERQVSLAGRAGDVMALHVDGERPAPGEGVGLLLRR